MELIRARSVDQAPLRVLARALVAEFGHLYPDWKVDAAIVELSQDSGAGLPLHLVTMDDGVPLGVASIIADDEVTGWDGRGWWLANVLVLPAHRGHGIGMELVDRAIKIAAIYGADDLHLVTDTADAWYLKQGWKKIGTGDVHGHPMIVMRLVLKPNS